MFILFVKVVSSQIRPLESLIIKNKGQRPASQSYLGYITKYLYLFVILIIILLYLLPLYLIIDIILFMIRIIFILCSFTRGIDIERDEVCPCW